MKIYIYNKAGDFLCEDDKMLEDTYRQLYPNVQILCEDEHDKRQALEDKKRQKAQELTQAYREAREATCSQ